MTWFKLDDNFPDNPKLVHAGGDAAWLYVCAGCYASKHETDGKVPKNIVARLSDRKNPAKLAGVLVDVGLWHDMGDCYEIHDFLEYNPSKTDLDSKRKAKSMAGAMGAAKRWASVSHPPRNAPDPTRPDPKENARLRGARISEEFLVTAEMVAWVESECPGVNWRQQTESWVDWAKSTGGQKAIKTDWCRAWKNAMRRARDGVRT